MPISLSACALNEDGQHDQDDEHEKTKEIGRLEMELRLAREVARDSEAACERFRQLQGNMDAEVQELTASLFQVSR